MTGAGKTASEEIGDIIEVLMFDCAKMKTFLKERDLGMIEVWFSEFKRYVTRMEKTLEECDQRIDYGEDWDQ